MSRRKVLAYLSALSLLLIAAIYTSTSRSATEKITAVTDRRSLKRSDGDRPKKSRDHDNLQTSWGSVRSKKVPLSSDKLKYDSSLRLDRREKGKAKGGSKAGSRKGGKGKGGEGRSKSSKKGGKGGKKKKSKSECSIGKGKEKSKRGSSSFRIDCEDFDFLGLSSSSMPVTNAADLEDCGPNVLEQAHSLPELSTFVQLVAMADLSCMFHCGGPFTLLAPTNEAFESLNPEAMVELLRPENQVFLQELIVEHILPGSHMSSDITTSSIETLLGDNIPVETAPLSFGDSIVQTPDIIGCNGVLHIVKAVLIPSGGTAAPMSIDQATAFPTPGRQPDPPVASPDGISVDPPVSSPVAPPVIPPASPPIADPPEATPVSPPEAPPVAPPVSPPEAPPVAPPVSSPEAPPVAPRVSPPEAPPVAPPVDPPEAPPVAPPVSSPEAPPVTPPVSPPVTPPVPPPSEAPTLALIDPPVAPPVATQSPSLQPIIATETPTAQIETLTPTLPQLVRVVTRDVFLALVSPSATVTPRRSEFESLGQLTTTYFDEYLRAYFADDPDRKFVRVESKLRLAKYGTDAGIPEERYNMYVEFESVTIVFDNGSPSLDAAEAVQLLKTSISVDYILNIPRMMTGTAFESTNEAYLATLPLPE